MDVSIDDLLARYNVDLGKALHRAIVAEARAAAAEAKLAEQTDSDD